MAADKKKISAYLTEELSQNVEILARARGISQSALVAMLLSREVLAAKQAGEIE